MTLPDRLADEPGAFPVGLYWAYNNVLSTDAGLDFQSYAGKQVTATLYRVTETLDDGNPNRLLRAVVLRHEGKVVGAAKLQPEQLIRDITLETRTTPELNRRLTEARQYSSSVDVSFRQVIGRPSGSNHFFVLVVKETERAPWLLDAFNSGPV